MRRIAGLAVLVALLAIAVLAGCAKKKITAVGNLPPETTLFVQGALDTVNHVVRIYWFGSDPDGDVAGYEVRLKTATDPDPAWVFTTLTDSTFTVFTPTGYSAPAFEVRAIDNEATRDPTPATADFQFSNQEPTVRFTNRLVPSDETYPTVTLTWTANDPDGESSKMQFQVGLDTIPGALHLVSGTTFTIDTTDFKVAGVFPPTQPRQVFIRAVDDGGRLSAWDSLRWIVRAPADPGVHPRLLLIDDAGNPIVDAFYLTATQTALPAGSYSVLRLASHQPFRSVANLAQTFRLFDAVVWYRGTDAGISSVMRDFQDGLAIYLDGGGQLMIESRNLVEGTNSGDLEIDGGLPRGIGALRPSWVSQYLGSDGLINAGLAGRADSTVSWTIGPSRVEYPNAPADSTPLNKPVVLRSTMFSDSLRNGAISAGLRGFAVRDTGYVALWARDSSLSPPVLRDIPIAVSVRVPEGVGPGRLIAFTLPIRGANLFFNAPRYLCKVYAQMGLGSGTCP